MKLFIHTLGNPSSPAILFIHGLGSSHTFYQPSIQLSNLAQDHFIISYDAVGHGLSPMCKDKITVESLVKDAEAVLAEKGITKLKGLVGHSLGSLVAMSLAAKLGDQLERLCLIGPVRSLPEGGRNAMKQRAATIKENGLIAIVDAVCQGALSNYTKLNSPLSTALVRSLILGTSVEGYAGCAIALAEAVEPKLELITAKTLILYGTEDYLINTLGVEGLCRDIQGAQAKELKNQGHWNCIEDPKMLAEEIEGWLRA